MRHRLTVLLTLASALAIAGCAMPAAQPVGVSGAPTQAQALLGGPITGKVIAPSAAVIAAGAGNVIAPGGGQVIAPGAGNVIAPGGGQFTLLALSESPLAETEVFLADAAGNPLPGIEAVKTDANGQYTFERVPANTLVMVVARGRSPKSGKEAQLKTLAQGSALGATANMGAASTMVTTLLESLGGIDTFKPAPFQAAVEATAAALDESRLPDFTDRAAIVAAIEQLASEQEPLRAALGQFGHQPLASASPTPAAGSSGEPEHPAITFKLPANRFAAGDFPLTLQFRVPLLPNIAISQQIVESVTFDSAAAGVSARVPREEPLALFIKRKGEATFAPVRHSQTGAYLQPLVLKSTVGQDFELELP